MGSNTGPRHDETSLDRAREEMACEKLSHYWGCQIQHLHRHYQLDAACLKGGHLVAWLEVKSSRLPSASHDPYKLRAEKAAFGSMMAKQFGLDFIVAVQFADRLGWTVVGDLTKYRMVISGRYDRGRDSDVGPMICIPIDDFQWVLK